MKVAIKVFRSQGFSDLQVEPPAERAAEFASTLRPDQVLGITHVMDGHIHNITVWYQSEPEKTS